MGGFGVRVGTGDRVSSAKVMPFRPLPKALVDMDDAACLRFAEDVVMRLDDMAIGASVAVVLTTGVPGVMMPKGEAYGAAMRSDRVVGVYRQGARSHDVMDDLVFMRQEMLRGKAAK